MDDYLNLLDVLNCDIENIEEQFSFPKSEYVDPNTLDITDSKNYKYKVLHINIQSVKSKFSDFCIMLDTLFNRGLVFDFILMAETFSNQYNHKLLKLTMPIEQIEIISRPDLFLNSLFKMSQKTEEIAKKTSFI